MSSNLPKRKKTAEEIAQLRESMGLGGNPPSPHPSPAPQSLPSSTPHSPLPAPHSVPPSPTPPSPLPTPQSLPQSTVPKPVRSLRKSERIPSPNPQSAIPNPQSTLPSHRRSDQELNQIRRAQAFEVQSPAAHLIALTAHPLIVGAGYFCVIAAAILPFIDYFFTNISLYVPATLCLAALAIAGFIFLKKKRSLHNAGFIATIAIFILIFGALYYFPHLRNAP